MYIALKKGMIKERERERERERETYPENYFSYFSMKTYVVGAH